MKGWPHTEATTKAAHSWSGPSFRKGRQSEARVQGGRESRHTYLHEGELLLAGVVVTGGPLVFLGVVGAVFVGILVRWVHKFP